MVQVVKKESNLLLLGGVVGGEGLDVVGTQKMRLALQVNDFKLHLESQSCLKISIVWNPIIEYYMSKGQKRLGSPFSTKEISKQRGRQDNIQILCFWRNAQKLSCQKEMTAPYRAFSQKILVSHQNELAEHMGNKIFFFINSVNVANVHLEFQVWTAWPLLSKLYSSRPQCCVLRNDGHHWRTLTVSRIASSSIFYPGSSCCFLIIGFLSATDVMLFGSPERLIKHTPILVVTGSLHIS